LKRIAGEVIAIPVGDAIELLLDRLVHFRMGMAETEDGGAAGAVDVILAGRVIQAAAPAVDDFRQGGSRHFAMARAAGGILFQDHAVPSPIRSSALLARSATGVKPAAKAEGKALILVESRQALFHGCGHCARSGGGFPCVWPYSSI